MFESHLFSAFLPTVCLCPLSTFLLGWALNDLPFVRQHSLVSSFQRGVYLYHSAETALASHSHFQMGRDPSETLLSSSQPGPQQQRSTQLPQTRLSGTSASPGSSERILSLFPHRPLLSLLSQVSSFFLVCTTAMVEVPTGSDCGHCLLSTHSQGKHTGWAVSSHLFYSCCCPSNRNKAREE